MHIHNIQKAFYNITIGSATEYRQLFDIESCRKGGLYMQVKVLGISQVKFTNNNGETVNGTNLYCGYKDENTVGIRADKFFLKNGIQADCKPNDTIELVFNMRGKVESVHKV